MIFCEVLTLIVKNNCTSQTKNRLSNVPNLSLPWKFKFQISILNLIHWKVMNKLTEWTTYVMCLNSVYIYHLLLFKGHDLFSHNTQAYERKFLHNFLSYYVWHKLWFMPMCTVQRFFGSYASFKDFHSWKSCFKDTSSCYRSVARSANLWQALRSSWVYLVKQEILWGVYYTDIDRDGH